MEELPLLREFCRLALAELSTALEERVLDGQDDSVLLLLREVLTAREWSGACEVPAGMKGILPAAHTFLVGAVRAGALCIPVVFGGGRQASVREEQTGLR